jgi:hypothetical protein
MQMGHRLAAISSIVNHEPVAGLVQSQLGCDAGRGEEKVAEQCLVSALSLTNSSEVFFGNDQDMNRRLGGDIMKGEDLLVFIGDLGRNLARNDLLKNGHAAQFAWEVRGKK